jgi:hypothetical protein
MGGEAAGARLFSNRFRDAAYCLSDTYAQDQWRIATIAMNVTNTRHYVTDMRHKQRSRAIWQGIGGRLASQPGLLHCL